MNALLQDVKQNEPKYYKNSIKAFNSINFHHKVPINFNTNASMYCKVVQEK